MSSNSSMVNQRAIRIICALNDVVNALDTLISEADSVEGLLLEASHSDIAENTIRSLGIDLLDIHDKLEVCRSLVIGSRFTLNNDFLIKQLQDSQESKE